MAFATVLLKNTILLLSGSRAFAQFFKPTNLGIKFATIFPQSSFKLIEDEVHFLFRCPTYSMIRNNFYYKIKTLIPNIIQLPENVLIKELMNSSNYFINIQFIKYISDCFHVRGKLLPK